MSNKPCGTAFSLSLCDSLQAVLDLAAQKSSSHENKERLPRKSYMSAKSWDRPSFSSGLSAGAFQPALPPIFWQCFSLSIASELPQPCTTSSQNTRSPRRFLPCRNPSGVGLWPAKRRKAPCLSLNCGLPPYRVGLRPAAKQSEPHA